jgi:hypothetical protein
MLQIDGPKSFTLSTDMRMMAMRIRWNQNLLSWQLEMYVTDVIFIFFLLVRP